MKKTTKNILLKASIPLILFANLASLTAAETPTGTFSDINNSSPYLIATSYLFENGIIDGYTDGSFEPFEHINRAELLKILIEGSNIEIVQPKSNCFPDVPYEEWYAPYICTAKSLNLINGYPDETFRPEQNVNKVETMKMVGKIFEWNTNETLDTETFSDTPEDKWFSPYIKYAKSKNLLPEQGDKYYPGNNITRGNVAETLFRFLAISEFEEDDYSETTKNTVIELLDMEKEDINAETFEVVSLNGLITDAQTGKIIENTSIELYKENENIVLSTESDKEGSFEFKDIPISQKDYFLFSKEGYFPLERTKEEFNNSFAHISLSQTFAEASPEELRIVLTWEESESDLDAHLLTPNSEEIFFMYKIDSKLEIILDAASTENLGTETITIKKLNEGEYEYFIHNYSKNESFQSAEAKIEVYDKNGLKKTYNAPEGEGEIWEVFQINEIGEIIDSNEIGNCEIIEKYSSICPQI